MPILLQYCTVEPQGTSNLAAIRFTSPVRIQTISVFPTGAQPFAQSPNIVSRTEPDAFFLELYFNAHPITVPGSKEKPKPTNALVPTVIAYAGGQMQFAVNMSPEQATRLMIVGGAFESISMAIYGEVALEMPPPATTYESKSFTSIEPTPISRALDPSNSRDPTHLARQLLDLISDAPPLPLIIRLMFCLKPSNDDWDIPEFPYLHPNLEEELVDLDLEKANKLTTRPVADDVSQDLLARFAESVTNLTGDKDDEDQAYHIAGILSNAASQTPEMAKLLFQKLDMDRIFETSNMDEPTLLRLLDASANADVARHLNSEWFIATVTSVAKGPNTNRDTHTAARQLISRIKGWAILEDAISNTQGDFPGAAAVLQSISTEEASFGIWLESMVTNQDLVTKLSENPVIPIPSQHPPLLFKRLGASVSHDEFIAFLRAFIGVSCVLAVYAWADSLPHQRCRERALGVLRLWQGVEGYREILNHLLLLRQMIFRLECMLDNDLPTQSGIDAEHIIVSLTQNPQAILRNDLMKCILALNPPHSYITYEERMSMRSAALIADDGLLGAVDELLRPVARPPTPKTIRALRVALALVEREIEEIGEYEVLQEFWKEGSCGLMSCLVDIFHAVVEETSQYFTLHPPPPSSPGLLGQLFATSDELLRLVMRLVPAYPLTGRAIRSLTKDTADLFVCTDIADLIYAQSSAACSAAQETRQSCIDLVRILADPTATVDGSKLNAQIVLRTLLDHGLHGPDRDPTHHVLQVFCLIDYLLPMPDSMEEVPSTVWTEKVLPNLLKDLWAFFQVLDTENKAHFIRRLVALDQGVVGIGDWLLHQELKELLKALQTSSLANNPGLDINYRIVKQYQASLSLRLLFDLMSSSSSISSWCIGCVAAGPEIAYTFADCLWSFIEQNTMSVQLMKVAQMVASYQSVIEKELVYPLALVLLRSCWSVEVSSNDNLSLLQTTETLLSTIPPEDIDMGRIGADFGALLSTLDSSAEQPDGAIAGAIVSFLDWFIQMSVQAKTTPTLYHISSANLTSVYNKLQTWLDIEQQELLDVLKANITLADEDTPILPPSFLPESIELNIQDLETLLTLPEIPIPSTPPRKALNQDILSLVTISPPMALIRSPASTGLTKTYSNNDFRQLRQTPSARQNTSRLPSMHVDDFESASSPTTSLSALPSIPMAVPVPVGTPGLATLPFITQPEGFQSLSPAFKPM